jgi:hypothetical protein
MKRPAALLLALALLTVAWPHLAAALAVGTLAVVLGIAGHHLPVVLTVLGIRTLARTVPGLPEQLRQLTGPRLARLMVGSAR